jgi:hypothetical protein
VHPIKRYNEKTPIDEMDEITVNLKICTLYKGVPYGLALIKYEDPYDEEKSFKGLGLFNDGELHNGPFTCIRGNGVGRSISKMLNGRPADESYSTDFDTDEKIQHVDSLISKTNVKGWPFGSGQINKEMFYHGIAKHWNTDGSIMFGRHINGWFTAGKKYELQNNGSHTLFMIKCGDDGKIVEQKEVSKGH